MSEYDGVWGKQIREQARTNQPAAELLPCPLCHRPMEILENGLAWCRNLIENPDSYVEWAEASCLLACHSVILPTEVWQAVNEANTRTPSDAWLPIETAPKDGTHILLGRKLPWSSSSNVRVAYWAGEWQSDFPAWQSDGCSVDTKVYCYWMPLPTAPELAMTEHKQETPPPPDSPNQPPPRVSEPLSAEQLAEIQRRHANGTPLFDHEITNLLAHAAALQAQLDALKKTIERESTCIVCSALLLTDNSEPPHCIDCQVTDEDRERWEDSRPTP